MKVAYLASQQSLPGPQSREVDHLEHQQMMSILIPVFEQASCTVQDIAWDDASANWRDFDAVLVGSTWDYCDRYEEFLSVLTKVSQQSNLFNPLSLIEWNTNKQYLRQLEQRGVATVPTVWLDSPNETVDWQAIHQQLESDTLVVKRQVGANAEGQFLLKQGEPAPALSHAMMVQPFLDAIVEEGEYSLIFIDGEFSHALLKQAKSGDYRIQASYGGKESGAQLSESEIQHAKTMIEKMDEPPLYARVDLVRSPNDHLLLMEMELVEPFLYPMQSTDLSLRIVAALKRRLA